jgi:hypothetical protein
MGAAGESDAKLIARLSEHEAAFAALAPEAAAAAMPRLQAPMVSVGPDDPAAVAAALRRGLDELSTLSSERAGEGAGCALTAGWGRALSPLRGPSRPARMPRISRLEACLFKC